MAKSVLSAPHFQSEEAAFEYVEERLWPNGPVCPHCEATGDKIGAFEWQDHPSRPAQVLRLPEALYRANGHHFRG